MTKSDISKCFKVIEKKIWAMVFTFNSNRKMKTGLIGMADHIIFDALHYKIIIVEVKLPGDTFSPKQKDFQAICLHLMSKLKFFEYRVVTSLKQAQELTDKILTGRL